MHSKSFRILMKNNLLAKQDFKKALENKDITDEEMNEIILKDEYVNEDEFYELICKESHINKISIDKFIVPPEVIRILPLEIVKKYYVIPFDVRGDNLYVAMVDPLNESAVEEIEFITNKHVVAFIDRKSKILYAIESYYGTNTKAPQDNFQKENTYENSVEDASIVKLTDSILNEAIGKKASDIHLEPLEKCSVVRFRVDGLLKEEMMIPKEVYPLICTRIKIISGMDISKKMLPQDGKMEYKVKNERYDLRISSIPVLYGEKIAIRILYRTNRLMSIDNLILNTAQRNQIKKILSHPYGIILITGPTGSGKSTTLCAILNYLNSREKNIVTIEDPIEYAIEGINQMNVNTKAGLTFSTGLRSILRQDPDILMIGEIRDKETAKIAVKAAITGHLVLSTLHTNDSASAILRLMDMDVPSYLISDSLVAIIAQRLIRNICPKCKVEYDPDERERKILDIKSGTKLYKGTGCKECGGSGYKGRRAVFEMMDINITHRELIRKKSSSKEIMNFSKEYGMQTLYSNLKELVKAGITTFDEIMRVWYEDI